MWVSKDNIIPMISDSPSNSTGRGLSKNLLYDDLYFQIRSINQWKRSLIY